MDLQMNERIVKIRKHFKITQVEFGEKINLSQPQLGKMERGQRSITDRTISDICREFSVNEEWLRYGKEPMFIEMNGEEEILALFKRIITKLDKDELKKVKEFLELFLKK